MGEMAWSGGKHIACQERDKSGYRNAHQCMLDIKGPTQEHPYKKSYNE
jgi:hypothetical protein